jgi:hypothetical protein
LGFYKKLLGKHQAALEHHKQEYLDLVLEHNALSKSLDKTDFEIQILEEKSLNYENLVAELQLLLKEKEIQISSPQLKAYRAIIQQLDHKLGLIKEIEEAIAEGVILNKKFNAAIKYVVKKAKEVYAQKGNMKEMLDFDVKQIDKYQNHMVKIQHSLIKFEAELNDVYAVLLQSNENNLSLEEHFMKTYRVNLIADIQNKYDLNNSHEFLKKHKAIMMNVTRTLRGDLRKLKKEVLKLEEEEAQILYNI